MAPVEKDYKTIQNSLKHNTHNKTNIYMMISVWTNPIVNFIFVGSRVAEQTQVVVLCQSSNGEYMEKFLI